MGVRMYGWKGYTYDWAWDKSNGTLKQRTFNTDCPVKTGSGNNFYGINGYTDSADANTAGTFYEKGITRVKRGMLKTPSKTFMAADAGDYRIYDPSNIWTADMTGSFFVGGSRHNNKVNFNFVDGHVDSIEFMKIPNRVGHSKGAGHPKNDDFWGKGYQ